MANSHHSQQPQLTTHHALQLLMLHTCNIKHHSKHLFFMTYCSSVPVKYATNKNVEHYEQHSKIVQVGTKLNKKTANSTEHLNRELSVMS